MFVTSSEAFCSNTGICWLDTGLLRGSKLLHCQPLRHPVITADTTPDVSVSREST